MLRARVRRALKGSRRPAWAGVSEALERSLGANSRWEILGTLVTLALIVPAYSVLTGPQSRVLETPFLWMASLGERDALMAGLVAAAILVKLKLGDSVRHPVALLAITLGCGAILFTLPACVLVWAFGVLLVTTAHDALAHRLSHRALGRALLVPTTAGDTP